MFAVQVLLLPLALLALQASLCRGACVEVDSDTEAVENEGFKLGCISCKKRGEVAATATVDWYFKAQDETDYTHIYTYADESGEVFDDRFFGRLDWNGSKRTRDLQDGSIYLLNVTHNDTGTYRCFFSRNLIFNLRVEYEFQTITTKTVVLNVVPRLRSSTSTPGSDTATPAHDTPRPTTIMATPSPAYEQEDADDRAPFPSADADTWTRGLASIVAEVMMYVTIIGLQIWLVVEMIYCYRKIAAAGEEALRESAAEYLAIASESKDNCAGVQVAE